MTFQELRDVFWFEGVDGSFWFRESCPPWWGVFGLGGCRHLDTGMARFMCLVDVEWDWPCAYWISDSFERIYYCSGKHGRLQRNVGNPKSWRRSCVSCPAICHCGGYRVK